MHHDNAQTFFLYVSLYLFLILFFAYVLLCGDRPRHHGAPIHSLHIFFMDKVPTFFRNSLLPRLLGSQERASAFSTFAATFFEKWIMPISYILILIGGLYTAKLTIIPRLPQLEVPSPTTSCPRSRFFCHSATALAFPPRTYPSMIPIYFCIAFISWLRVFLTDPGTINAKTYSEHTHTFPYDEVLFLSDSPDCRTCHHRKIPRSKHCALCDRCVARFDHHCGWVGTCVGLYNTRHFVNFLALHCIMVAHGAALCAEIIRARMQFLIGGKYIYTPTNSPITGFSFQVAFAAETTVCVVFIVFLLTFFMVAAFLVYHLYLVARNVTTNESVKWQSLRHAVKAYEEKHGKSFEQAVTEEAQEYAAEGDSEALARIPRFDSQGMPKNIYNRGVLANGFEVFMPHMFVRWKSEVHQERSQRNSSADTKRD